MRARYSCHRYVRATCSVTRSGTVPIRITRRNARWASGTQKARQSISWSKCSAYAWRLATKTCTIDCGRFAWHLATKTRTIDCDLSAWHLAIKTCTTDFGRYAWHLATKISTTDCGRRCGNKGHYFWVIYKTYFIVPN